ncbi:MAG: hypothetical protein AAFZ52_06020 [Bacteroidota bacterium]
MFTPRLRRTLRYCLVAFVVIAPLYYVVYGFIGEALNPAERLQTSLIYAVINVVFLGALHYYFAGKK